MGQERGIGDFWRVYDELNVIKREMQHLRDMIEALQDSVAYHVTSQHPFVIKLDDGTAVIRGTEMAVQEIAEMVARGNSVDEILEDYTQLSAAQVYDALSYYHEHRREFEEGYQ